IDCPDEEGKVAFERTLSTIVTESTVKSAIDYIHISIDPSEPLFILLIKYIEPRRIVKFSDVAMVKDTKDGKVVSCENDKYFPGLMRVLWEKFGRDSIEQLSRYEVMVRGELDSDVLESVVYDPMEDLMKGLVDVIFRIIPEGFRIRKYIWGEGKVVVIASEDTIMDEFVERAKSILRGNQDVHATTI
ncbi:MAG: methanogenesis marker 17 protein, partial [Candidatus Korarchaeum sp.]|nr:methanogenesis marker 17 protein [Candidatus Korarchaeum sp.]